MSDDPKRSVAVVESSQDTGQGINWTRTRDIAVTIVGWLIILAVAFWAAGHIIGTLLVLAIAALIAYALAPIAFLLRRWIPWPLAIAIVYLVFIGLVALLFSFIIDTIIQQAGSLAERVQLLLTPGRNGNTPLVDLQHQLGITDQQINDFRNTLFGQLTGFAHDVL
ncbi:MAG TPA: AI-2E family transporter, partial [Ktedonobacterales bacterium]